jgi:hypothetical protein
LYMGIFSILLVVLLQIFSSTLSVHAESQSTTSIQQDSTFILNRLTYDIHRANTIVFPSIGGNGNSLHIIGNGPDLTYSVDANGALLLTDNSASTTEALTSNDTKVVIQFKTLGNTASGSKPSVQILLTITSKILRDGGKIQTDSYQTTVQVR